MTIDKVTEQYDRLAQIYDRRWYKYIQDTLSFLIAYLQPNPTSEYLSGNEQILDIACGTGELEKLLLNSYPQLQIIGVDISENMLEMARSKLPNLEFIKAEAIALPFDTSSFDLAITASAFHYFDRPDLALTEIHRVLKPNGKLIIMDWCRDYWTCKALDLFLKVFDPAHKGCYNQEELQNFLAIAGFKVVNAQRQKLGIFWGIMIATGVALSTTEATSLV
jgi:ubiquinone/menaquinone biosynthesis C-methylase UbiE